MKWTVGVIMFALLLVAASIGFSYDSDGGEPEVWTGEGTLFSAEGDEQCSYRIEVVVKPQGEGKTLRHITITLPDGRVEKKECTSRGTDDAWSIECEEEKGAGFCLGGGLCHESAETGSGGAYSMTIAKDGDQKMRMLRHELRDGKPVAFYRETYTRVIK